MKTLLLVVFVSLNCFAIDSFDYSIQMSEKTTRYSLKDFKKSDLIKTETGQEDRKVQLTVDNQKFISEQIQEISKLKSNDLELCRNGVMKIEYKIGKKSETKLGCINSLNPTSQKLTVLANLLGYL
jgi:hypothetical protein